VDIKLVGEVCCCILCPRTVSTLAGSPGKAGPCYRKREELVVQPNRSILLCAVFSPTIGQANALERAEAKFVSASGSPKATRLGGYYKFYPGIIGLRG
jgi:hypothetical protein